MQTAMADFSKMRIDI